MHLDLFSQSGLRLFKVQFINFINQFIKRNLVFFAKRMDMSPMLSHHSVGHGSWALVSGMRGQYSTTEPPILVGASFSITLYFCFREVSWIMHVFYQTFDNFYKQTPTNWFLFIFMMCLVKSINWIWLFMERQIKLM